MGFLVKAVGKKQDGSSPHFVQTRWRSDDPWGTLDRAMTDALDPFMPREIDRTKAVHVARVEMDLFFIPDAEDQAVSPLGTVQPAMVEIKKPGEVGVPT